jgi:hypothetical protein
MEMEIEVGSVVYRAGAGAGGEGTSGMVMEPEVAHKPGFVDVLWEGAEGVRQTSISELSLQPLSVSVSVSESAPESVNAPVVVAGAGAGGAGTGTSLSLEEKLQILNGVGSPAQLEQVREVLGSSGLTEDPAQRQQLEGIVDLLLQDAEGMPARTSSCLSLEEVRTKLALISIADPELGAALKTTNLDTMNPEQLAKLNAALDSSQQPRRTTNYTEVDISTDFPDSSMLKYFGQRTDAPFAR